MSDRAGEVLLEKYTIERELGRGGMGYVVAARHRELDELVAIKLILREHATKEEVVRRFMREARAAARIASEHVVRVMDVGRLVSGEPYMVMELLRGQDMEQMLATRGPLPIAEAIDLVAQVLEAVAEAHAAGIVHRDLKPANLYLNSRRSGAPCVKVLDFGISKLTGDSATETRGTLGSPLYMSPEQLRSSADVDHRTDIWALGVILFELFTGRPPFVADTLAQLVVQVLQHEPPRLRELRSDVPPDLEAAVMRCLAKDRGDRFASVTELARAIAPFGTDAARRSLDAVETALPGAPPPRQALASSPDLPAATPEPPSSSPMVRSGVPQRTVVMSVEASTMDPVATRAPAAGVPSRRKAVLLFVALTTAFVMGITVVGTIVSRRGASARTPAPASETTAVVTSPSPVLAPEPWAVAAPTIAAPVPSASAQRRVETAPTGSAPSRSLPRASTPTTTVPTRGNATSSSPPPTSAVCSPPYTIGPGGTHIPKPECI